MSKLRDVGNQEEMMAKDKAEERRIFREMLSGMTTAERNSLITKDKLFPPIHYQAESEKGKDRTVLYFMKKVRDALPPRPNIPNIPYGASAEAKEQIIRTAQDKYIDMISGYCDLIQELDSLEDCRNFPNRVKEYSYQQLHDDAIPENVALDPNNIQKFSLGDIAKSNGVLNVDGTQYKVYFMAQVVSNVAEQHRELTQPEQVHTQESPAQEIPTVQETAKEVEPNLSPAPEAPQNTQEATQPTSEPPQVNQPAPEKQPSPAAETPFMGVPENTPAAVHELPTEKQTDISKDDITDALDSVALEGQGVAYDEVRDDAENAEKSSQTAPEMQSSGFTNSDVSKLIDVIAVQNTVLTKQSEALMAQTNKLVEVMETQNQMIRSIIELQHNSMGMDRTPVQEAPAPIQETTSADIPAAKTPQEKLRAVQDVIRDVRKEINSPSGSVVDKDMSIVLSKLSNMANNLDKQEQQHKKSSPQKGVEQGA